MSANEFAGWVDAQLDQVRAADRWRVNRTFDALGPIGALDGREVVNFASNDYLGLASDRRVMDAAIAAIEQWGTSATASRLIVGSRPVHDDLEAELSDLSRALEIQMGRLQNDVRTLKDQRHEDVRSLEQKISDARIEWMKRALDDK